MIKTDSIFALNYMHHVLVPPLYCLGTFLDFIVVCHFEILLFLS